MIYFYALLRLAILQGQIYNVIKIKNVGINNEKKKCATTLCYMLNHKLHCKEFQFYISILIALITL